MVLRRVICHFYSRRSDDSERDLSDYVKGEHSVLRNNDDIEMAWKGYAICNDAITRPNSAWDDAQKLISVSLDPGISKSQVLFWISTQDDFSLTTMAEVSKYDNGDEGEEEESEKELPKGGSTSSVRSCNNHLTCLAANLKGSCCPTNDGKFLECCS